MSEKEHALKFDPSGVGVVVANHVASVKVRFSVHLGADPSQFLAALLGHALWCDITRPTAESTTLELDIKTEGVNIHSQHRLGKDSVAPLVEKLLGDIKEALVWPKESSNE